METSAKLNTLGALALNRVFGSIPKFSHTLIAKAGSIGALFSMSETERNELLGPYSKYRNSLSDIELAESEKELDKLTHIGARFIDIENKYYPKLLKECPDAPVGLYYRSDTPAEVLFGNAMISVVGTRDISAYGAEWCQRIISKLSKSPIRPCIVSGLALGVDGCAHRSALEYGLPTIGVLPTGIESFSPRSHFKLSEELAHTKGCALISDFPIGYPVTPANFLRRNRIIAGLSSSTLLIESKKHGGGLITSRLAFDYGRNVYVLPGRIDDIRSQGCNNLLEENKAEAIASLETLSDRLGLGHIMSNEIGSFEGEVEKHYCGLPAEMSEDILTLARLIRQNREIDIEALCGMSGLAYKRTLQLANMLEKDGFIHIDLLQRCTILIKKA